METVRSLASVEKIQKGILEIRGHRVMLDADLAVLYGVETRAVIQAVKRNRERFPADFLFQLSAKETADLKSQFVISSSWGGRRRSRPYAFTEQGLAMLSSVLRSSRAVRVNIAIMRAFVLLRQTLSANAEITKKLDALEHKSREHDIKIDAVFQAIRALIGSKEPRTRCRIGFRTTRTR